ncbi:MAG: hypothetical protein AAGA16_18710 [Cyanobacteria bacterium P01_E01_bin.35]
MGKLNQISLQVIAKKSARIAGIGASIGGIAVMLNWTFLRRLLTYPPDPITNVDWYQPLATVKGKPEKLAQTNSSIISNDSLKQITAYAEAAQHIMVGNGDDTMIAHRA